LGFGILVAPQRAKPFTLRIGFEPVIDVERASDVSKVLRHDRIGECAGVEQLVP
jgi:hypothetical protein